MNFPRPTGVPPMFGMNNMGGMNSFEHNMMNNGFWGQNQGGGPMYYQGRPPMHQSGVGHPYFGGPRRPPPNMMLGIDPRAAQAALSLIPSPYALNAAEAPIRKSVTDFGKTGKPGSSDTFFTDLSDFPETPYKLKVEYDATAIVCEVRWHAPTKIPGRGEYTYFIEAHGHNVQTMELPNWKTQLKMRTTPGQWYTVWVRAIMSGKCFAEEKIQFKSVFTRDEINKLYQNAVDYIGTDMVKFEHFFRCKPQIYFDDIRDNRAGIMEVYQKDDNGQAASPINGNIKGLFWSARPSGNGQLPTSSPFGNIRMAVPGGELFDLTRCRLWFADFYCNYTTHYVTVVVTERGSQTDQFCERSLVPLDMTNNPFVKAVVTGYGQFSFYVNRKAWTELYYTENVPISIGDFAEIMAVGAGTSRPGGLPHNKYCTICNLYPISRTSDVKEETEEQSAKAQQELSNKQAEQQRRKPLSVSFNSTFHICMCCERDRLIAESRGEKIIRLRRESLIKENELVKKEVEKAIDEDLNEKENAEAKDENLDVRNPNLVLNEGVDVMEPAPALADCGDADLVETMCTLIDCVIGTVGETIALDRDDINLGTPYDLIRESIMRDFTRKYISDRLAHPRTNYEVKHVKQLIESGRPQTPTNEELVTVSKDLPQVNSQKGKDFLEYLRTAVEDLNKRSTALTNLITSVDLQLNTEAEKLRILQEDYPLIAPNCVERSDEVLIDLQASQESFDKLIGLGESTAVSPPVDEKNDESGDSDDDETASDKESKAKIEENGDAGNENNVTVERIEDSGNKERKDDMVENESDEHHVDDEKKKVERKSKATLELEKKLVELKKEQKREAKYLRRDKEREEKRRKRKHKKAHDSDSVNGRPSKTKKEKRRSKDKKRRRRASDDTSNDSD